jgi:peptide chain release factor 1
LHTTHVDGEGGLVTDGRGNTTEKGRHLGTGLGETENVVNEEKHILTLLVTEVLGDGKTSKSDTGTGTWGLVHLTEDESDLGVAVEVDDTSLLHFVVQIVTLTSTLTDTSEDGVTTVSLGDVVNELLNEDGLADTGTTEKTNLTTTGVGGEEVDDLDTSDKNLGRGGLVNELGGLSVDGGELDSLDGTTLVNGVTSDVHDATETAGTDGNLDGGTSVDDLAATDETLGTVHGHAADDVLTQVLGDLEDELLATVLGGNGVENGRQLLTVELDVDDGTNDLVNSAIGVGLSAGEALAQGGSERRLDGLEGALQSSRATGRSPQ